MPCTSSVNLPDFQSCNNLGVWTKSMSSTPDRENLYSRPPKGVGGAGEIHEAPHLFLTVLPRIRRTLTTLGRHFKKRR